MSAAREAGRTAPLGVLLMTFGSAVTAAEVPEYLASVRRGKPAPPELVAEFQRRFRIIGRSPLIDITRAQAAALQDDLDSAHGVGSHLVAAGMLHSEPTIARAVAGLAAAGVTRIVAVVLSPQYSPVIMSGYPRALQAAVEALDHPPEVVLAGPWHLVDGFVATLSARLREALEGVPERRRDGTAVIFTAHSLPRAVVDRDPGYIDQLRETADAVAERAGIAPEQRVFAYQSAGHTPEEWLRPDVKDLLAPLRASGHDTVLVVPVQFLSDHLEVLYDIDVAAGEEAEAAGMHLLRIEMPNLSPTFIRALAHVVERERRAAPAAS